MGISQTPQALVPAAFSSIPANDTARVDTDQTTTSTSYTDLATVGPSVTLTTGTKALVIFRANVHNGNNVANRPSMDFAISGATTRSAGDTTNAVISYGSAISSSDAARPSAVGFAVVTLTAGSNTFTAKYKTNSGTPGWSNREIAVINLA